MSKKPVEVKPDGIRRAASEFDGVADTTKKLLDTLKAASESKGEPWGGDKAGRKFADGEQGYKKNRDNTVESLSKVVEVFRQNATNLRDTATMYEENERRASNAPTPQNRDTYQPDQQRNAPIARTRQNRDTYQPDEQRNAPIADVRSDIPSRPALRSSLPGSDPAHDSAPRLKPFSMRVSEAAAIPDTAPSTEGVVETPQDTPHEPHSAPTELRPTTHFPRMDVPAQNDAYPVQSRLAVEAEPDA
ncbi:WXG100 family type VII secretion target [Nocardia pseudovaccinii]|uniref:WXG100 family type VII secretion target n=1 Tax=Nocardia pseudovaccinii TaxID=189540 RepID=UPI0007A457BF|nr:WXG100 family type VII secretion target [Nocardia pseudovaccinii]